MNGMHLTILVFMIATLLVLVAGIVLMMKGGTLNEKYGNRLMVARVTLQGLTIALLGLFFLIGK